MLRGGCRTEMNTKRLTHVRTPLLVTTRNTKEAMKRLLIVGRQETHEKTKQIRKKYSKISRKSKKSERRAKRKIQTEAQRESDTLKRREKGKK